MCYATFMTRLRATGSGRITRWLGVICWLVLIVALEWYWGSNPATWPHVSRLAAIVVGVAVGLVVRRARWWLALAPLIVFVIGGFLLSTQFSNTRGYGGGDWSVSAIVIVGGIANGLIATLVLLATLIARDGLRTVAHLLTKPQPKRHAAH